MIRIAGAALAVGLVLGGSVWSRAEAFTAVFDYKGAVGSGVDTYGYFGTPGSDLSGQKVEFFNTIVDNGATNSFLKIGNSDPFVFVPGGVLIENTGTLTTAGRIDESSSYLVLAYSNPLITSYGQYSANFGSFTSYADSSFGFPNEVIDLSFSSVVVDPVPLPASFPMFGGALLALGALAYRKRRQA